MTTTGEQIAQLRKARKMTQASLAKKAGVSTSSIAMYETNRRQPEDATIQLLADALEVDPSTFGITDAPSRPAQNDQPASGIDLMQGQAKGLLQPKVNEIGQGEKRDAGWTNLTLSRDEARFILFMRMHPDSVKFLQDYMNADGSKRKQIEKAWRLIQAFQA